MKQLREIWPVSRYAGAVLALALGVSCLAAVAYHSWPGDVGPEATFVQPLPLIKSPDGARFEVTDRVRLVRRIQGELQRSGCYAGAQNGLWTPATRRAMEGFLSAANAKLPTGEPDEALLSLVESGAVADCRPASVAATNASLQTPTDVVPPTDAVLVPAPSKPYREAVAPTSADPQTGSAPAVVAPVPRSVKLQIERNETKPQSPPRETALADVELLDGPAPSSPLSESRETSQSIVPPEAIAAGAGAGAAATTYEPDASQKPRRKSGQKLRPYKSRPPKFVRSLMRNLNKTIGGFGF